MAARKKAARKKSASRKAVGGPRELIDTGTNKLFVRRNQRGTSFAQVVDVSRSLSQDRRRTAKKTVTAGYGDQGDRAPTGVRKTAKRGKRK